MLTPQQSSAAFSVVGRTSWEDDFSQNGIQYARIGYTTKRQDGCYRIEALKNKDEVDLLLARVVQSFKFLEP